MWVWLDVQDGHFQVSQISLTTERAEFASSKEQIFLVKPTEGPNGTQSGAGALHSFHMWQIFSDRRADLDWKQSGWRRVVGICCILLLLFAASAELNHSHASGRIHSDCSLCVTAHSAAQAVVVTVAAVALRPVAKCVDPQPLYIRRTYSIRLSIRPPPVAPDFA
jgi:hypothetical protein